MATQLGSRIRETFHVELSLRALFDEPTVEDLALQVLKHKASKTEDHTLSQLLDEIQHLPEEEVAALLAESDTLPDL